MPSSIDTIRDLETVLRESGNEELAQAVRLAIALVENGDTESLMEALAILEGVAGQKGM